MVAVFTPTYVICAHHHSCRKFNLCLRWCVLRITLLDQICYGICFLQVLGTLDSNFHHQYMTEKFFKVALNIYNPTCCHHFVFVLIFLMNHQNMPRMKMNPAIWWFMSSIFVLEDRLHQWYNVLLSTCKSKIDISFSESIIRFECQLFIVLKDRTNLLVNQTQR